MLDLNTRSQGGDGGAARGQDGASGSVRTLHDRGHGHGLSPGLDDGRLVPCPLLRVDNLRGMGVDQDPAI